MRHYLFITLHLGAALFVSTMMPSCTTSESVPETPSPIAPDKEGCPIAIHFSTLAQAASRASGSNALPSPLAQDTKFRVYVYSNGSKEATGLYTVGSGNQTVSSTSGENGYMSLYRGTYDFYLVSDNTPTDSQPTANDDGQISVNNGTDFICTTLKDVVVQPTSTDANSITIPVNNPFSHLSSQLWVAVTAASTQPKAITSLAVNSIKVENLSSARTYNLGGGAYSGTPTYNVTFSTPQWNGTSAFTTSTTSESGGTVYTIESKGPYLALPTDGSTELKFTINLSVSYTKADGSATADTKEYIATTPKALLPGTKYRFEFALTFFGDLAETDMALTVKTYTINELITDEIGGDPE